MEHEGDDYTNCDWCFGTVTKGLLKGLEDLEVGGRKETIQITALFRTAKILSPGDLRILDVTHSSERPSAEKL